MARTTGFFSVGGFRAFYGAETPQKKAVLFWQKLLQIAKRVLFDSKKICVISTANFYSLWAQWPSAPLSGRKSLVQKVAAVFWLKNA
jgi:hypothetical protein